jgi:hypothetical protein
MRALTFSMRGACSSAVERPAHNWLRVGSNPTRPNTKCELTRHARGGALRGGADRQVRHNYGNLAQLCKSRDSGSRSGATDADKRLPVYARVRARGGGVPADEKRYFVERRWEAL